MPNAKIDRDSMAPPENTFSKPNIVPCICSKKLLITLPLIPGVTTMQPTLIDREHGCRE